MNNRQQGIALVMVLVFLLLMTLISATAIQQNALQFAMIGNTQEQTQAYAHAENIVNFAEQWLEQQRWSAARIADPLDPLTNTQCKETAPGSNLYGLIAPGTVINLGIAGSTAVVQSWWCQNNPDMTLADIDQNGDGNIDGADARYGREARCTLADVAAGGCPPIPTSGYAPFGFAQAPVGGYATGGCGTELYTIRMTFAQQNASEAERIVESKYAVRCLTVGN